MNFIKTIMVMMLIAIPIASAHSKEPIACGGDGVVIKKPHSATTKIHIYKPFITSANFVGFDAWRKVVDISSRKNKKKSSG